MAEDYHIPVLLNEVLEFLQPRPGKTFLDATLGGAGHSVAIAQAIRPGGTLIALDRDQEALAYAEKRLAPFRPDVNIILLHSAFGNIAEAITTQNFLDKSPLDGALYDLGVSSWQLDSERGFSFRRDEPLDMRMDTSQGVSAKDLLATASEAEIARILWEYGEERWAKRIAQFIVNTRRERPIETTGQLAAIVEAAVPKGARRNDIHAATLTFMGIRIAINRELEQLEESLTDCITLMRPQGRIGVISYHSLEERLTKQVFQREAGRLPSPSATTPAAFLETETPETRLHLVTRKPIVPSQAEIARNPRARSAKMRVAERVP